MGQMKQLLIGYLEDLSQLELDLLKYRQLGIADEEKMKRLHYRGLEIVVSIYGKKSEVFEQACKLDPSNVGAIRSAGTDDFAELITNRHRTVIAGWEELIRSVSLKYGRSDLEMPNTIGSKESSKRTSMLPSTKNVFVMHGHDEVNLGKLKDLLRDDWKLKPIIMKEHAPLGLQTFLHKFEELGKTCSYAIALFTKDDFVEKDDGQGGKYSYFQGRPNVIFELGWFTHYLGHDRIILLVQQDTKLPTDLLGIEELRFKKDVTDQFRMLQKCLQKAKLVAEHGGN